MTTRGILFSQTALYAHTLAHIFIVIIISSIHAKVWLDVHQTGDGRGSSSESSSLDGDTDRENRWRWLARQRPSGADAPNPNDEESVPSVVVHGKGPGQRAGHTATAVNRRLYVFGGSCGSEYLSDFFVLDTDAPPEAVLTEPTSMELLERRLRHYFNDEEFSDVTFVVEGRLVYGHRLVLTIASDCFRAMFTTGFRESEAGAEIQIPDCSYEAFLSMMEYIYTGRCTVFWEDSAPDDAVDGHIHRVVELMELADQFFLDHLKQQCEMWLQTAVGADTVEFMQQVALKTNAAQLLAICSHFERNRVLPESQDDNAQQEQPPTEQEQQDQEEQSAQQDQEQRQQQQRQ